MTQKFRTAILLSFAFLTVFSQSAGVAKAAISEPGFETEVVAGGFTLPTAMTFAADGRIFVAEKAGTVRVVKNGTLLPKPVITLSDVNTFGDHGIIGIVADPNFVNNGYLYLSYTFENTPGSGFSGEKTGRIVRITVKGDTASEASKLVLVGTVGGNGEAPSCLDYPVGTDCIASDSMSHTVGGLRFGPDGKLYASLGDGSNFDVPDPRSMRAQSIDALAGKLLRINPDGTGPTDNPFYNGNPNSNRSKVYAYGLRNAFRFNFHPTTGALFIADVGWSTWEEINRVVPGGNYGWPCYEGATQNMPFGCTAPGVINPIYFYGHNESGAGSITAGSFPSNGAYPAQYGNSFFFGDYAQNWIKRAVIDSSNKVTSVQNFMDDPDGPVDISTGIDGNIYYLSIYTGELHRITHTTGNRRPVPVIAANPTSGTTPLSVAFSSAGSTDPDSDALSYSWNFGDGSPASTLPNPTHSFSISGTYNPVLTITDARGATAAKILTVSVGNQAPSARITAPASGALYEPNHIIQLSGNGTDPENGTLPASVYHWTVILHHNTHIHIVQEFDGVANPSFIAPDHGSSDVYMEFVLTVTDSQGLVGSQSINMYFNNGGGSGNLVSNPSVEAASISPGTPEGWIKGTFGLHNFNFSYPVPGLVGAKAARLTVTGYVDGSSKWYFDPVFVTPGQRYAYSNTYTANVVTTRVAQFGFSNGTYTYVNLGDLPATSTPSTVSGVLTVPANVQTLSIFHELERNGTLTTDNYSLTLVNAVDVTQPAVSISSPDVVWGRAMVTATATDNVGVIGVTLQVDGRDVGAEDTVAPYTFEWSTNAFNNGTHVLTARARDAAGNARTSASVSIRVDNANPTTTSDTTQPAVAILAPAPAAFVWGMVAVSVSASDNVGVTGVTLQVDGKDVGAEDTVAPYEFIWATTPAMNGTHLLTARARDAAGNVRTSAGVALRSDNAPIPSGSNLIVNGSFEAAAGANPAGWTPYGWGNHSRTFTYPAAGRDGGKAITVQITAYPMNGDGDSRWIHDDIPVTPGTQYTYSNWYKSTVVSDIIGRYTMADGSRHYFGVVTSIPAKPTWTFESGTFIAPVGAVSVSVLHMISAIGALSIDDVSLAETGTGEPDETEPPTVAFVSPANNGIATGLVNLVATATDNVGVTSLQFAVDGIPFGSSLTSAPFTRTWDSTYASNGLHTIKATAYDAVGNNVAVYITLTIDNSVPLPASGNEILNPSLETTGTDGNPVNWIRGGFGTNTAVFTYPVAGVNGGIAAKLDITSYTSGDAKWYFPKIPVIAGHTYSFSHQYKATVPSGITYQFAKADGSVENIGGGIFPAVAAWTPLTATFVVPADAVSMTIFATLNMVGSLTVDDYVLTHLDTFGKGMVSLSFDDGWMSHYTDAVHILDAANQKGTFYIISQETLTATPDELILNASLNTVGTGGYPANWMRGGWGINTPVFTYPVPGANGLNAAKLEMTSYSSGDAKWYFADVAVVPNRKYVISDSYSSTVSSQAVMRYKMADGTVQFAFLGVIPSTAGTWQPFSSDITIPANAVSATMYHVLASVGSLTVDNYSLRQVQEYINPSQMLSIQSAGHEIAAHTKFHPHLTELPLASQQVDEIAGSKSDLLAMGALGVTSIAYPYGNYDDAVQGITRDAGYAGARGVDRGFNTKSSDKFALKIQQVDRTTTAAQIQAWVSQAAQSKTWLILMFHQIDGVLAEDLGVTPAFLQQVTGIVAAAPVDVVTVGQGLTRMLP